VKFIVKLNNCIIFNGIIYNILHLKLMLFIAFYQFMEVGVISS